MPPTSAHTTCRRCTGRSRIGHENGEQGAAPGARRKRNRVFQHGADTIDDGQAQPKPAAVVPLRLAGTAKFEKDRPPLRLRNTSARIPHHDLEPVGASPTPQQQVPLLGVAHGVTQEVAHHSRQQRQIRVHPGPGRHVVKRQAAHGSHLTILLGQRIQQGTHGKGCLVGVEHPGVQP